MIYLMNLMKWHTLHSQMNVIINTNLQQHAERVFETLHMYMITVSVELL